MELPIRVFIADSSGDFLELLRALIEEEPDMTVVGLSGNGRDACAQLREQQPDVLVTDLLLPGLDGLSMLRRLKEEQRMPRTMVVSAFVSACMAQALSRLGVDDYIQKPCQAQELLCRIRELADPTGHVRPREYDPAVRKALKDFGILPHLDGRRYLQEAVQRAMEDRSVIHGITKILYPDLAKFFRTTSVCVERSMRSAVQGAWNSGTAEQRRAVFGTTFDSFEAGGKPPSNALFIAAVAEFVEIENEKTDAWKSI